MPSRGVMVLGMGRAVDAGCTQGGIVCESPAMRRVMQTVAQIARRSFTVLLRGETGTGKEVLARALHECSPRAKKPMICLNCGAISPQLVESTLFGHERGAFTGADQQRRGIFEEARGGTVLLDEIGELPAAAQASLLRVLETKRINRVGSNKELEIDVRVLAATHRDLEAMCDAGTFRLDLLHRLNTFELHIPPLRARREDIGPLALGFLAEACGVNNVAIEAEALALLEKYPWPGNVRELRNVIERAVAIAGGTTLTVQDLPEKLRAGSLVNPAVPAPSTPACSTSYSGGACEPRSSLKDRVSRFEAQTLLDALRDAHWNVAAAACRLGLPVRTMHHKMKALGIKRLGFGLDDSESPTKMRTAAAQHPTR